MLTFGSLFAGIGGFDLGLERAGMACAWQVEREPYAVRVLEKHWPNVTRWREIETFPPNTETDWKVDLICAGVPCQPISLAGKRKGRKDERWMWGECLRVVATLNPKLFVAENPTGLLSHDRGRTFAGLLSALQAAGYGVDWTTIAAADLGAPHRRERVFLVARKASSVVEVPVLRELSLHHTRDARTRLPVSSYRGVGHEPIPPSFALADANGERLQGAVLEHSGERLLGSCRRARRDQEQEVSETAAGWWTTQPDVGRVAHGVPHRVDRLRGLGNAVVPQIVELIGRAIIESLGGPAGGRE